MWSSLNSLCSGMACAVSAGQAAVANNAACLRLTWSVRTRGSVCTVCSQCALREVTRACTCSLGDNDEYGVSENSAGFAPGPSGCCGACALASRAFSAPNLAGPMAGAIAAAADPAAADPDPCCASPLASAAGWALTGDGPQEEVGAGPSFDTLGVAGSMRSAGASGDGVDAVLPSAGGLPPSAAPPSCDRRDGPFCCAP